MSDTRIGVIVVLPLLFKSVPHPAGALIQCSALDALDLCASGRAKLANPDDAVKLRTTKSDAEQEFDRVATGHGHGHWWTHWRQ